MRPTLSFLIPPSRRIAALLFILCIETTFAAADPRGIELISNIIYTRTDVSDHAGIMTSAQKMFTACEVNDFRSAKEAYESTLHSKHSLRQLATMDEFQNIGMTSAFQTYGLMSVLNDKKNEDNTSNIYQGGKEASTGAIRHNFDKLESTQQKYVTSYTHQNLIEPTFAALLSDDNEDDDSTKAKKCLQIATAAVWQITYLHVTYELYGAMNECSISGDPNYNNAAAGLGDLNVKIDEFIAYWVGSDVPDLETVGTASLFVSTNAVAGLFDKNQENHGMAHANAMILGGYEALSGLMSDDTACDVDSVAETVESMWIYSNRITSYMMIPLIQHLIIAMLDEDQLMIDVYAGMVVPQLSQCRHSNFLYLRDTLLNGAYDSDNIHDVLKVLQDSYECLGILCRDIGTPNGYNDSLLGCKDSQYTDPELAGYMASTDVREEAKMDLDIHHMKILMSFENEHYWKMAKHIYLHGKNSIVDNSEDDDFRSIMDLSFRSLHSLARSDLRKGTLFYNDIVAYTGSPYYADYYITDILNEDRHADEPIAVKSAIISNMILTQVVYSYVLGEMGDALNTCDVNKKGNRSWKSSRAWDEVAAYMIGSLEGPDFGGSDDFSDGELLWSLANKRGIEFDRLNSEGYAIVNSAVLNYLLSGKGQIEHANCDNLERTVKNLSHMLLIPAIQTMVKYALSNQFLPFNSGDEDVYNGEVYAKLLIPIYGKYDQDSAKVLQNNMIRNFQSLVNDGPQVVADAYLDVADDFGIQCEFIGKSFEVDACLNYKPQPKVKEPSTSNASKVTSYTWKLAGVSTFVMLLLHSIL